MDYVKPIQANGLSVLGALAKDVLALSKHHAEELFYMTSEGTVRGSELGYLSSFTSEELMTEYAKQVVNGPWSDKLYFYIPKELKDELSECGFQPQSEPVLLNGVGMGEGYVLRLGLNTTERKSMVISLPFIGAAPEIWTKQPGDAGFSRDTSAVILDYNSAYILAKVNHPGEFVCIDSTRITGANLDLWKAFMK